MPTKFPFCTWWIKFEKHRQAAHCCNCAACWTSYIRSTVWSNFISLLKYTDADTYKTSYWLSLEIWVEWLVSDLFPGTASSYNTFLFCWDELADWQACGFRLWSFHVVVSGIFLHRESLAVLSCTGKRAVISEPILSSAANRKLRVSWLAPKHARFFTAVFHMRNLSNVHRVTSSPIWSYTYAWAGQFIHSLVKRSFQSTQPCLWSFSARQLSNPLYQPC